MPRKSITPSAPRPPQPPAAPPGLGRRTRPGGMPKATLRGFGPKWLRLFALPQEVPDWCAPWPGFVGAHTSIPEQMIYAAISKITGDPPHPEQPPYAGGTTWSYQDPLMGGRLTRGGSVCDFLVHWGAEDVCIRLQSERYHVTAEIAKRADELYEKAHGDRTVDIYEEDFVADCSLSAACAVVANALAGRDAPNPGYLGTAQQTRRRGGAR
jgi:hypothetical protein